MLPGTNDNSGQPAAAAPFLTSDFDTLSLSLLRPSVRIAHMQAHSSHRDDDDDGSGDERYFTCCSDRSTLEEREEFPIRRAIVVAAAAAAATVHLGERRRKRRRDGGATPTPFHTARRESRAGEGGRITRTGTGSSVKTTTTTAKIRTSPVASLFPLHRWGRRESRQRREGVVAFSGFR